ncbi:hypothetical protein [Actinosynnema sp. NPDC023587]|uniref:hypothetical protein n=1 Tax=Actinosynnema sp. NPDC023587 TaxID=3154695 RepID=UPI0033C33F71
MSIVTVRSIFCDVASCGHWHGQATAGQATLAELRRAAARAGWTRRYGGDFCPDHDVQPGDRVVLRLSPNGTEVSGVLYLDPDGGRRVRDEFGHGWPVGAGDVRRAEPVEPSEPAAPPAPDVLCRCGHPSGDHLDGTGPCRQESLCICRRAVAGTGRLVTCIGCGQSRHHHGRGCCYACFHAHRKAGTLDQLPRLRRAAEETQEIYRDLTWKGRTREQIAEHLGIGMDALNSALARVIPADNTKRGPA